MKKIIAKTTIKVYSSIKELSKKDQALLALAKKSLKDSYSPYSNFKVGAAIRLKNGKLLGGSNQENAAYSLCICAERVALSTADSQYPGVPVVAIAVTAKNPKQLMDMPISPCGACRQSMAENELKHQQKMKVILQGEVGDIYILKSAKALLPLLFDGSFL